MMRNNLYHQYKLTLITLSLFLLLSAAAANAQTTSFTYQGRLQDGGSPANGTYDFQFRLFDAAISGNQVASTLARDDVSVSNGTFTVTLDFGAAALSGADRFLELGVRPGGSSGAFTTLSPLQQLTSTPYAVRSLTAANTLNASQLGGIAASSYVQTTDPRLTDARPPAPGSSSYVQNSTLAQPNSNFNVSGDGTAGGTLSASKVNALTQYELNGNRVLSVSGDDTSNTFTGVDAGLATTPQGNTLGNYNSFFGRNAGASNTTGFHNSYFGGRAGFSSTTSVANSFFGTFAGESSVGGSNSFFGASAGRQNTSGGNNSFFGEAAGDVNTTGSGNTFFGAASGFANDSGQDNSFFGKFAGNNNKSGSGNTIIGSEADLSSNNLTNASAIGSHAFVSQSNSLVLGSINGVTLGPDTNVGIGTTAPGFRLHVVQRNANAYAANIQTFSLAGGSFGLAVTAGTNANDASFTARNAGGSDLFSVRGNGTVGIGTSSPTARLQVEGSGLESIYAHSVSGIGLHARSEQTWAGYFEGFVFFSRGITLTELAGGGSGNPVCRNSSNELSNCSSSLRYKRDINSFGGGLDIVNRLRPISFTWKQDGTKDIGLGAEEVEKVAPLFTFRNDKGEIEGVRYDRLSVVFVNAFKEQQAQIEKQEEQLRQQEERIRQEQAAFAAQQQQFDALKALLCRSHRNAKVCR